MVSSETLTEDGVPKMYITAPETSSGVNPVAAFTVAWLRPEATPKSDLTTPGLTC